VVVAVADVEVLGAGPEVVGGCSTAERGEEGLVPHAPAAAASATAPRTARTP